MLNVASSASCHTQSLLFADLPSSRPSLFRAETSGPILSRSRESEASLDGYEEEIEEFLDTVSSFVVPSFSHDALFGSTTPRKRSSASPRSRASWESGASSSTDSPAQSPVTPIKARASPLRLAKGESPNALQRPRLARLVSEGKGDRLSVVSSRSNRDGLKIAMAELELELERTMVTLSQDSPAPSTSRASSRAKSRGSRRPSTADALMSVPDSHFQQCVQSSHPSSAPMQQSASMMTISSTISNCSHHHRMSDSDSESLPSLVHGKRDSNSSGTSSIGTSPETPARSFVTGGKCHRPDQMLVGSKFATVGAKTSASSFYVNRQGARSVPSLSTLPPCEPLPPVPIIPSSFRANDVVLPHTSICRPAFNRQRSAHSIVQRVPTDAKVTVTEKSQKPLPSLPPVTVVDSQPRLSNAKLLQPRFKRTLSLLKRFS